VLAVIIWIVTSLNIGVAESKTVRITVPIELGDQVSEQLGMQYYSLNDTVDLSVTISGAKYVVGQVTQDDLSVKFDTSSVNRTGEQTIPIQVTNASNKLDFEVTSIYPQSVTGYFDVSMSKTFNVDLNYDKTKVASGYVFGEPVLSEKQVVVTGPKTYVNKVESVVCNVDIDDNVTLTEPFNADCQIEFVGSSIESSYLSVVAKSDVDTEISSISVTLPVLKKTKLPVAVAFENKPDGFLSSAMSVSYSVNSINAGILDSADISSAIIGTIDFSSLSVGENEFTFDITNLEGITVLDKNLNKITATITISDEYSAQTVAIDSSKIVIDGVPDGYTAKIKSISSSNAIVVASDGKSISASDITLRCNVSDESDDNLYPIRFTINSDKNSWVYGSYNATIELVKNK
jgi:YbbR domain-containing protein